MWPLDEHPGLCGLHTAPALLGLRLHHLRRQTRFGFENITKEWAALERAEGVALYFGLGPDRIGDGDGGNYDAAVTQWQTGHNLADMIGTGREVGADGYVLYRYDFLFHNGSWADLAASECAAIRAENQVA